MSNKPVVLSRVCPPFDQLEAAVQSSTAAWQWTMKASVNPGSEVVAFCRL
jgi:hypothetical protein